MWLAFLTSIAIAVSSLVAAWTLVIPAVLFPLPARILRRSFNYTDVRNALIGLPMAVLITDGAISRNDDFTAVGDAAFGIALFAGPALFLLIRGGSFRRWVKPSAARPSGPGRKVSRDTRQPATVRYRIDAVPEDRGYADCVEEVLSELGHERVEDGDASVLLRFVSQFHDVTDIDPAVRTIPIVVADPDDDMPVQLRRTQWIDLRRGMDRRRLEALGRHLDEPNELFRIIGSPPPHEQRILPKGVQGLFVTLWIGIGTVIGYAVLVPVGLRSELGVIGRTALVWSAALGLTTVGAMLWLTRKLRQRRPGRLRASLIPLLALGVVAVAVPVMVNYEDHELSAEGVNGMDNANAVVIVPLILMLYFWLFKSGAIRRWIPARPDDSTGDVHDPAGTTRSSKTPPKISTG